MDIVREKTGGRTMERRSGVASEAVYAAFGQDGELLKASDKSLTKRVDRWVVKQSADQGIWGVLKRSLLRRRYRRVWDAAVYLAEHGVPVAAPVAFVEYRRGGMITANAAVTEYLEGFRSVEEQARLIGTDHDEAARFLTRLAETVNLLEDAQAYHADLSGKNILTADGERFCFIDLDGVYTNVTYTRARRLKNHIQLYDSFCDLWGDSLLEPFIRTMQGTEEDRAGWFAEVLSGQARRRARIEAIWRKEGRL